MTAAGPRFPTYFSSSSSLLLLESLSEDSSEDSELSLLELDYYKIFLLGLATYGNSGRGTGIG